MKQFLYTAGIVLCSLLLAIPVLGGIINVIQFFNQSELEITLHSITVMLAILMVISAMLVYAMVLLIKAKRRDRAEKNKSLPTFDGTLNIRYTGRISYADYRNLLLGITLKRPVFVFFIAVMILLAIVVLSDINAESDHSLTLYLLLFMVLYAVLLPVFSVIRTRQYYKSNVFFQTDTEYHITNDELATVNSTADSTVKWTRFYRVTESRDFLLLYYDRIMAVFIDKRQLTLAQVVDLKQFIESKGIPCRFK